MFCWVVESIVGTLESICGTPINFKLSLLLCPLDMGMKYSRRRKIMEIVQHERGENKEMPKTDTLDALDDEMKHTLNIP